MNRASVSSWQPSQARQDREREGGNPSTLTPVRKWAFLLQPLPAAGEWERGKPFSLLVVVTNGLTREPSFNSNSPSSCLGLLSAGNTGMCYQSQPDMYFYIEPIKQSESTKARSSFSSWPIPVGRQLHGTPSLIFLYTWGQRNYRQEKGKTV